MGNAEYMGVIRRLSRFLYTVTHLFTDLIMADFLNKKYKLTSSENFDEYTLTTSSLLKTTTIKFKLGEEFEKERADGVKVKSTITLEGNKMTHVMKGEPETTIIREFN